MSKRMLQLVVGLLAVGVLAVAPTAATADASPTAKLSGGGGGCQDNWDPQSSWGNGNWNGDNNNWGGWGDGNGNFGGQSWDQDCGGNSSTATAARVGRVKVAVQRLRGSQCQHLSASDNLGSRTSDCGAKWMKASGTRKWSHSIANPLPAGSYRLMHQAVDSAGNRGKVHVLHKRIR
ncbi:MAG TPA: hypothetical protein VNP92_25715 [Actinophytocola sp.]|nr:hypothetical protein [Actinophytocola sp.]